ncbi:YdcH family protein [Pseudomonas sp. D1-2]|uniref:YdcH family protein n=1 Tax=unclassified Pseudomonas TaxID=196821 RepID=UPI003DA82907
MPVSHDLCQDLKCTEDDIQKKREKDKDLDALITRYSKIDTQVVKAEKPTAVVTDDDLDKLKKERLRIKDDIAALMQK